MGKVDCIFCMNVLIYFSEERQAQLVQRFYEYLEPGGYLFLGHAESISKCDVKFETHIYRDALIYQKPTVSARAAVAQERAGASTARHSWKSSCRKRLSTCSFSV